MNAEQFATYIENLQAAQDRANTRRDRIREQHRILDSHIRSTPSCDGSSIPLVRDWMQAVSMARPYFPAATADVETLKLVIATLQGPMRRCYEHFLDSQDDRNNVTWAAVKTHLRAAYLTSDESEFLRSELQTIKQSAYESTGSYSRRFVEAANKAYDEDDRNAVVQQIVLDLYMQGLYSSALMDRLILEVEPTSMDEATAAVASFAAKQERLKRLKSQRKSATSTTEEEPMEIGAFAKNSKASLNPASDPSMADALLSLARQMQGVQKEVTKLKASSLQQTTTQVQPLQQTQQVAAVPVAQTAVRPLLPAHKYPSHTPDGQVICYECGGWGHIGKNCAQRHRRLAQTVQQSGNY